MTRSLSAACLLLLLAGLSAHAQPLPLIPYPQKLERQEGSFPLAALRSYRLGPGTEGWAKALPPLWKQVPGGGSVRLVRPAGQASLRMELDTSLSSDAAHRITVTTNRIFIEARSAEGAQHAVQTLVQLLSAYGGRADASIPCLRIEDAPAFPYRGLMLDVARHFLPLSFLFDMIDRMAALKMNRLHLHLTDDQGWRMEVRKYPRLTSVGAWRNGTLKGRAPGQGSDETPHGGYYTQADLRRLVAHARDRHIEVIPEIDLPGHMSAAIAAYPALSCFPEESTPAMPGVMAARTLAALKVPGTKVVQESWGVFTDVLCPTDYTFRFLEDVLDEVMDVFPSKYIHIGGDECPKEAWKRSVFCQDLIRERGLGDEHGLQSHVIRRMEAHVNRRGRSVIGWDEILEGGLAPNATVMSWRGVGGGIEAARQGHDVVMSPVDVYYLNLYQSEDPRDSIAWGGLTTLRKVYDFNPVPAALDARQARHVIGVQANLWSEYLGTAALAEYMLFPRLLAVAEAGWRRDKTGFDNFVSRASAQVERMRSRGVNSSEHLYEIRLAGRY
ncbi:MAG: beta-N-acetylhexosaminidase, partial [Caulobacteraceae bacterium]|nr:beta-N-acetylhexosaminidase [Caulobacteraceae bacterium]